MTKGKLGCACLIAVALSFAAVAAPQAYLPYFKRVEAK